MSILGKKAAYFPNPEEQFGIYNFVREDDLSELTDILVNSPEPRAPGIFLAGEAGSGRSFLLAAAAYRAQQRGQNVRVGEIDLRAHEIDSKDGIEKYLVHQLSRRSEAEKNRFSQIFQEVKPSLKASGPQIAGASLFSISLGLDLPSAEVVRLLKDAFTRTPGAKERPVEAFYRFFRHVTRDQTFVVHVKDWIALPDTVFDWLRLSSLRFDRLVLAFSCRVTDSVERLQPIEETRRYILDPLTLAEVPELLDRNFGDGVWSEDMARIVYQYSSGLPPRAAQAVQKFVGSGSLRRQEGGWEIDRELNPTLLAQPFEAEFYARIEELLEMATADERRHIEGLVQRAALCGVEAPVGLILDQMEISGDLRNTLLDLVDEVFEEDGPNALFIDHGFGHPSFPRVLTYGFANSALPYVVTSHMETAKRVTLANSLAAYLDPRLQVRTRGVARLRHELASHVGDTSDAERYRAELRWWVAHDEADELAEIVGEAVESGEIDSDYLWAELHRVGDRWPSYKRFVLLEAYARRPDGIPLSLAAQFWGLRALLLFKLGRYHEALEDAERGLSFATESQPMIRTSLFETKGFTLIWLARYKEARPPLAAALEILHEHGVKETALGGSIFYYLAMIDHAEGNYAKAREGFERALAIEEKELGPNHPSVATTLDALAAVDHAEGNYAKAREGFERALAIEEKELGPNHPSVATTLHALARVDHDEGDYAKAREGFERALAIKENELGPNHPSVAATLHALARVDHAEGDYAKAREGFERALAIEEKELGPNHPSVARTLHWLGRVDQAEELDEAARKRFEQALGMFDEAFGRDHPWAADSLAAMGSLWAASGDVEEAERCLRRALEIREARLPPTHPDTIEVKEALRKLRPD